MDQKNDAFDSQAANDFAQIAADAAKGLAEDAEAFVVQEVEDDRLPSARASGTGPTPIEKCQAEKMTSSERGQLKEEDFEKWGHTCTVQAYSARPFS